MGNALIAGLTPDQPWDDLKIGIAGVGQLASPMQVTWVVAQLKKAMGTTGRDVPHEDARVSGQMSQTPTGSRGNEGTNPSPDNAPSHSRARPSAAPNLRYSHTKGRRGLQCSRDARPESEKV